MRTITTAVLLSVFGVAHALEAQTPTPGKRDSLVADSLVKLRPYNNGWRLTSLNRQITALRTPHPAARVDTVRIIDTVFVRDSVIAVNQAPVATFARSCASVTRLCSVNASATTDDGGAANLTYTWAWGDNTTGPNTVTASHTYAVAGSYQIRLVVADAGGLTDTVTQTITLTAPVDTVVTPPPPPPPDTASSIATQAALPQPWALPVAPAPTRVDTILPGMDLQAALTRATAGTELRLSGTFTGNFTVAACGAGYVTVTTLGATGTGRVRPSTAAAFAKIVTPNFEPAIRSTGPLCKFKLANLEVTATNEGTTTVGYGIIRVGDYGAAQDQLSEVPADIILERVYVHGSTNHNNTRCIVLNATRAVVRDSWISDCHARGFDSQSVLWWNTPGQILLENNYLEGAGENVMSGGADPSIFGLIPSDITIRRNHFYKPLAWKTAGWSVKNLFELKNARRVLVENNVFEQVWPASQEGMAIVIKSSKDSCPTCDWQGTVDLTFRNNIVRSAAVGLNLQARDGPTTLPVARVTVTDNLFERIGAEGRAALMLLTHDLSDVTIHRNVFLHDPSVGGSRGSAMTTDYANGAARRLDFRGNVMMHGAYGFIYNGAIGSAALQGMAGDGSWRYLGNTMVGGTDLASKYPTGNTWLATLPTLDLSRFTQATQGVVVSP